MFDCLISGKEKRIFSKVSFTSDDKLLDTARVFVDCNYEAISCEA